MGLRCQILIEQPKEKKHIIGQSIIGILRYTLNRPIQIKKISVVLVGQGRTEWICQKKSSSKDSVRPTKHIGNDRVYVEKNILDNATQNLTIPEGTYEHPFEIELPLNIPPSVKTEACEITYFLAIKFEKPTLRQSLRRYRSQNIKLFANIPEAIQEQAISFGFEKNIIDFAKLFSRHKRKQVVRLNATLENAYLVSGKETRISFEVANESDIVVGVRTEILCKTTYRDGAGNEKSSEATLKELRTPDVPVKSVANMFSVIPVWSDLFTVRYSKVMTRNYRLKVTLKTPLPHTNQSIEIPISIGERFSDEELATMGQIISDWEMLIKG